MYCLPVSSLLVPSTQFLALFYYLQFPYAIDKLYRVHCPRSGHVHPRKHIVPITSLLLRFSSLQDRSCSVHLPCNVSAQVATPERLLGRPFPVHPAYICLQSPLCLYATRVLSPTLGFFLIFIFVASGPIGLYNGFVIKVACFPSSVYYPNFSGGCGKSLWCSMPSSSTTYVARCTITTLPLPKTKRQQGTRR